jgi:hypothetical protein
MEPNEKPKRENMQGLVVKLRGFRQMPPKDGIKKKATIMG